MYDPPGVSEKTGNYHVLFDMDNALFDIVDAQLDTSHAISQFLGMDE